MSLQIYFTHTEVCTLIAHEAVAMLAWLDAEIGSAERFAADGINLPNVIDMYRLNAAPDAVAQMDLVWMLFDTAAMEGCGPEQRQALLSTARTITGMYGLEDLLLATLQPYAAKLANGFDSELTDIHAVLQASQTLSAGLAQQGPHLG